MKRAVCNDFFCCQVTDPTGPVLSVVAIPRSNSQSTELAQEEAGASLYQLSLVLHGMLNPTNRSYDPFCLGLLYLTGGGGIHYHPVAYS